MGLAADPSPPQLSLLVLRVADLTVSRRFYGQLGLVFREEQHGQGPEHLSAVLGSVVVELYPRGSGPSSEGLRLGLLVADINAARAACEAAVVEDRERDGQRVIVVRDPDGHKVELIESLGSAAGPPRLEA